MTIGDLLVSFEDGLSALESDAAGLIERIIAERSIGWLSHDDRELLATFVAVQMTRGPHMRESLIHLDAGLRRVLVERFGFDTRSRQR